MNIDKKWFSPSILIVLTWTSAHLAAYLGPREEVLRRYGLSTTFTPEGFIWASVGVIVFILGVGVANRKQIQFRSAVPPISTLYPNQLRVSAPLFYFFGISLVLLLIYWTITAVNEVGSIESFVQLISSDWHAVRRIWPDQKPFTGARLLYTAFISVVLFASAGLAQQSSTSKRENISRHSILFWVVLMLVGLIPLMILPILVSQRILLAIALTGAVVVYGIENDSGISIKYPVIGLCSGMGVWTTQEVVRAGLSTGGLVESLQYSVMRILFYFSNDIGNLHRGIAFVSERSYGFGSFNFVFEYLFIEDYLREKYFSGFYSAIEPHLAGGGFTGLGIPYMDFGVASLGIVFMWGYLSQSVYIRTCKSILFVQIYGLIAASIMLSWHVLIWSNPLFWLNTGIVSIVPIGASRFGFYIEDILYERR